MRDVERGGTGRDGVDHARVDLDGGYVIDWGGEETGCEIASAGADLEYGVAWAERGVAHNGVEDARVGEQVLPPRFVQPEPPVPRLRRRRQGGGGAEGAEAGGVAGSQTGDGAVHVRFVSALA